LIIGHSYTVILILGGPLLCQNQQGYWTIYGITSFGEGCGQRYGIYSKVPNYTSWIRGVIKSNQ